MTSNLAPLQPAKPSSQKGFKIGDGFHQTLFQACPRKPPELSPSDRLHVVAINSDGQRSLNQLH